MIDYNTITHYCLTKNKNETIGNETDSEVANLNEPKCHDAYALNGLLNTGFGNLMFGY